jgi:hypothetical protein
MASNSEEREARRITELTRSGTTADSTDSGQGSEPLTDAYVAVEMEKDSRKGTSRRVKAPGGSAQLEIRRSARVASARSKSVQGPSPGPVLVKAPPGMKPSAGYKYQLLQAVPEVSENIPRQSGRPTDPSEKAGGSRDTATTQASSKVSTAAKAGRKRSATSAADFSPTHFDEPQSDGLLDAWKETPLQIGHDTAGEDTRNQGGEGGPTSPMAVDPKTPASKGKGKAIATPNSTPISHNPILRRSTIVETRVFSPAKHQSDTYYTRDPNAAWLAAEGLMPVADGFRAAGYMPTQIVGGVSYKVHSPKTQHANVEGLSSGRKLFAEYMGDPHRSPRAPHTTQQVMALHNPLDSCTDTHIVRTA